MRVVAKDCVSTAALGTPRDKKQLTNNDDFVRVMPICLRFWIFLDHCFIGSPRRKHATQANELPRSCSFPAMTLTEHGVSPWTSATTMKTLRDVVALLWIIGMAQLGAGFKPNLPPLKDAKVLVVGASGQVGELVRTAACYCKRLMIMPVPCFLAPARPSRGREA